MTPADIARLRAQVEERQADGVETTTLHNSRILALLDAAERPTYLFPERMAELRADVERERRLYGNSRRPAISSDEIISLLDAAAAKDAAYRERNLVVAALAKLFPSGTARTDIPGWEPEWHGCVYIDLPTGQVSWHYHDMEAALFSALPAYSKSWDGHSTDEKYARLSRLDAAMLRKLGGV